MTKKIKLSIYGGSSSISCNLLYRNDIDPFEDFILGPVRENMYINFITVCDNGFMFPFKKFIPLGNIFKINK